MIRWSKVNTLYLNRHGVKVKKIKNLFEMMPFILWTKGIYLVLWELCMCVCFCIWIKIQMHRGTHTKSHTHLMPHCTAEDPSISSHPLPHLSRATYLVGTQTSCWEPHTDRPHTQWAQTHALQHILPTEQIKYTQLEFCLWTCTHTSVNHSLFPAKWTRLQ